MKSVGKFRRVAVSAWGVFRDNFVMLAVMVAALWLLVVWLVFIRGGGQVEGLAAYAMFGTALATLLLGLGTALMAREARASRKLTETLIEENRRLADAPRIRELIIQALNPLLESVEKIRGHHERREYMWTTANLGVAKELLGDDQDATLFQSRADGAFLPHPQVKLEELASNIYAFNETLYRDLGRKHSSLIGTIQEYDKKAEGLRHLLLDLAKDILCSGLRQKVETWWGIESSGTLRELTLSTACLTFNKLLGASEEFSRDQIRNGYYRDLWGKYGDSVMEELISRNIKEKAEHMAKDADDLADELKGIEAELVQIKNTYLQEYHLTHEETEGQEKKPHAV